MSGKAVFVVALLVALLVSDSASSPESSAAREAKGVNVLQRLLAKREKVREAEGAARAERRTHLSEDDREIMTKQIMQAITGMVCPQR
ncbi:uncharacterized protein V3H82_026816 isoform 2-T2 [Fundulus diaphanus]